MAACSLRAWRLRLYFLVVVCLMVLLIWAELVHGLVEGSRELLLVEVAEIGFGAWLSS